VLDLLAQQQQLEVAGLPYGLRYGLLYVLWHACVAQKQQKQQWLWCCCKQAVVVQQQQWLWCCSRQALNAQQQKRWWCSGQV
jgi:hypothetical protein